MRQFIAFCVFLVCCCTLKAQYTLGAYNGGQSDFNSYAEMTSGKTANNQVSIPIQYYGNNLNVNEWKLTARLTQDFVNESNASYTIGAQYAYLQFNSQDNSGSANTTSVNVPTQLFQLSKYNEITLIQSTVSLNPQVNRLFRYNLFIKGGNHLLVSPNGMYNSAYEFKLYKISGGAEQLIGIYTSRIGDARFHLNYGGNYGGQSVVLQNGAQQFNLSYATAADYTVEKSVTIANALKLTTYNYQLAVQASGDFISASSSQTLPLSNLKLQLSVNQNYPGLQIVTPVTLTTSAQPVAYRTSSTAQEILFNVKFYIPANSPGLNAPPGTYSTHVYFLIIPN